MKKLALIWLLLANDTPLYISNVDVICDQEVFDFTVTDA